MLSVVNEVSRELRLVSFSTLLFLSIHCPPTVTSQGFGNYWVLQDDQDPMVSIMKLDKVPTENYADVGGLDQQIQEIKLWGDASHDIQILTSQLRNQLNSYPSQAHEEMGIHLLKGVILYGVPGTGKRFLAKAVANQMSATFLHAELIQKYLGDGPKLVQELFRIAEEHAPSIVFIDEIYWDEAVELSSLCLRLPNA